MAAIWEKELDDLAAARDAYLLALQNGTTGPALDAAKQAYQDQIDKAYGAFGILKQGEKNAAAVDDMSNFDTTNYTSSGFKDYQAEHNQLKKIDEEYEQATSLDDVEDANKHLLGKLVLVHHGVVVQPFFR